MDITELLKRYDYLRKERSQWDNHYDDLARVFLPRRLGFSTETQEGGRRNDDIFDGTPMQAARGLANSIGGLMRPHGIPNFRMRVDNDALNTMEEVQIWLSDSERRMMDAFNNPKARFRPASAEKDLDLTVFGTAVMFIGEKVNSLLFQTLHLKNCVPVFSDEGMAEGLFRKHCFTLRQAVARFGENKLHPEMRKKFEKNPDDKADFLHCVLPRNELKRNPLLAKNLPFADIWIDLENKHTVKEGGFHEFPFIIPRWDTSSGEYMGRSPAMIALPDADTLQAMGETILIAGQRAADPPLAVPNDGAFSAYNTFPGGLVSYDVETAASVGGNPFFAIESGTNLPISRDMQRDTRDQIFNAFFRHVLNLPVEGPQMTATEVMQRKEEFTREIGPIFEKLETDDTSVTVERVFMIMLRGGGFAPIPEALQGQNVSFEYDSPAKRVRQQVDAMAARMWFEELAQVSQLKPEVMRRFNADEYAKFLAEAKGVPRQIINSDERVAEIAQAEAEQQQAMQEQMAMEQMANVAKTGAEAANKAGLIQQP